MEITTETIEKLAKLSSLELTEEKKETLKGELGDIVSFINNLNDIDVSKVDAQFTTIQGGQPLREDTINANEETAAAIMRNAPKTDDGYFIVPQIIE